MFLASESVGDIFATGGITAGLGLSVTFLMLGFLIFFVTCITKAGKIDFNAVLAKIFPNRKKKAKSDEVDTEVETVSEVPADDKKLVAAITAAIAIVLSAEGDVNAPKAPFKVKSIKRI